MRIASDGQLLLSSPVQAELGYAKTEGMSRQRQVRGLTVATLALAADPSSAPPGHLLPREKEESAGRNIRERMSRQRQVRGGRQVTVGDGVPCRVE